MIPKSITPTELRNNLYGVVREVAAGGHPYLVTPADGESVVMCSREEYNALIVERQVLRDLRTAEADVAAGRTHTTANVREFLANQHASGSGRSRNRKGAPAPGHRAG